MLRVFGVHGWLRAGEGIGWLAAGTMPSSLYRMPLVYLFLACVFCYSCSFLFVVFCAFVFFFCSHWSLVDVPLIFDYPADHVPDWQPRVLLGMVEARSVNVKKTTTTTVRICPSDRFCRVQNLPTSSVELFWPITELYFGQILSTDFMNRLDQDVKTGPKYIYMYWYSTAVCIGLYTRYQHMFYLGTSTFVHGSLLLYTSK